MVSSVKKQLHEGREGEGRRECVYERVSGSQARVVSVDPTLPDEGRGGALLYVRDAAEAQNGGMRRDEIRGGMKK